MVFVLSCFLLWLCARLFIWCLVVACSWLSSVMYNCEFVTFPMVSWVRCGTWLYRFLISAPYLLRSMLDELAKKERVCFLYIPNKSENATLQLSIFLEKVLDKKYLIKLNNFFQTSSKRCVETPTLCLVWCLNYALFSVKRFIHWILLSHAQIKNVMLIEIGYNCVA